MWGGRKCWRASRPDRGSTSSLGNNIHWSTCLWYTHYLPHQCQEGEGNSVRQSVSFHIAQLLCLVCNEHTLLAHTELGVHCHSQVLSNRAAPKPACSWSVSMSLMQRLALVLVGHCEVSVGMMVRFLKILLHWSFVVNCVTNASALPQF